VHQLDILMMAAPDTQLEKRTALQVITALNTEYQGQLELVPSVTVPSVTPSLTPDFSLVLVWSEADPAFANTLKNLTGKTLLFKKTDRVALDLSNKTEVLEKLERKAFLDELLSTLSVQVISFSESSFYSVFERELRQLIEKQLGLKTNPLNFRPNLGATYLRRKQLLKELPDSAGHVVQLEAPYGYGKTVLAAQWAEQLEAEGWRILWLSAQQKTATKISSLIAEALGVAPDTPEPLLREQLWKSPTLLVLEDLTNETDLDLILDDPTGLVLLASREALEQPQLLELAAANLLTHLGANDLAFSLDEAEHLTGDQTLAASLHAQTLGWALPLHVATLTGTAPDATSLVAGIEASLSGAAWRELLFLAALPYLPRQAATSETQRLVTKGFVQALQTSYRLHPYLAEQVLELYPTDVTRFVAEEASRLPLLLQGEAFEKVGDVERLAGILGATEAELWRQNPVQLVNWDKAIKGLMTSRRHWAVGVAQARLANFEAATQRLLRALEDPDLSANEQLGILRELCVPLGITNNPEAQKLLERAEPLLKDADPELAARFLTNAAIIYAHTPDPVRAIALAERALERYPSDSQYKVAAEINLVLFRYDHTGDFSQRHNAQIATLERVSKVYPVQALGQCRDIGMFYWWLGDLANAKIYLERAQAGELINPAIGIEARAALAFLRGDYQQVSELTQKARLFKNPYVADMISMYKIFLELDARAFDQAAQSYNASPKESFSACAYARVLAAQGDSEAAKALLDSFETAERNRRLYLSANRYLVSKNQSYLDTFLSLTTAGARLLPGFILIEELPETPELSRYYPIREVLFSGRQADIAARQADIPDLVIHLLGTVSVRLLSEPLELTERQKHVLTLFILGLNRDEIAEAMWPEVELKKQRNNFNVQLTILRKLIEPWGLATYLLEHGLQKVKSDCQELTTALASRDAETVLALYQPFAPGVDLSPVEDERERLQEDVVRVLFEAGTNAPSAKANAYLERVLQLEPLHEDALQSLLKHLVQRGRRREAKQRYLAFKERLYTEMGLEPLEETRGLVEQEH
jgi:DNA-binding SARP family transcriptional activator